MPDLASTPATSSRQRCRLAGGKSAASGSGWFCTLIWRIVGPRRPGWAAAVAYLSPDAPAAGPCTGRSPGATVGRRVHRLVADRHGPRPRRQPAPAGLAAHPLGSVPVTATTDATADPDQLAAEAAVALAERTGAERHDVALVLGSGWLPAVETLAEQADADVAFPSTELPGFVPPSVAGHARTIRSLQVNGKRLLAFLGRTHFYEGHGVATVVHGVRMAARAGCQITVLTNGCGGLRTDMGIGQP